MKSPIECISLTTPKGTRFSYTGPKLDKGPMGAVFYFALSSEQSLTQDPYNQPIQFLDSQNHRVFSIAIPSHDLGLNANDSLQRFAQDILEGKRPIEQFCQRFLDCMDYLKEIGAIDEKRLALSGLSRGAFMACHALSFYKKAPFLLLFAPMTSFSLLHVESDSSIQDTYDIRTLVDNLYTKQIQVFIGNHDTRVQTKACYDFVQKISEKAYSSGIRSPQIALTVYPSIGYKGHGTPPEIFQQGALWLQKKLS